jgi:hypothetical protein
MAQDKPSNGSSGFTLPPPGGGEAPAATGAGTVVPGGGEALPPLAPVSDTSSRDLLIGIAVLLVLCVGFFFAKNGYANSLVARRVPPVKANFAGWSLFVALAAIATAVVLVAVNAARFLTPLILGPLAAVALLSLVLMVINGRR